CGCRGLRLLRKDTDLHPAPFRVHPPICASCGKRLLLAITAHAGLEELEAASHHGGTEGKSARRRTLESLLAGKRVWSRPHEPGIRSSGRNHGPLGNRAGSL